MHLPPCPDLQLKVLLARNVLLFTLLIDGEESSNKTSIWNIYYHMFLDQESLELLEVQSKKLHELAKSIEGWHSSKYGELLRFCDKGSLEKVREVWGSYDISELSKTERTVYDKRFKDGIQKAADAMSRLHGHGIVMTSLRSTAPAFLPSQADLPQLFQNYW